MVSLPHPPVLPESLADGVRVTAESAMDGDFDGARLCLAHVREVAANGHLSAVYGKACALAAILGPAGSEPGPGLGQAIVDLVHALDA